MSFPVNFPFNMTDDYTVVIHNIIYCCTPSLPLPSTLLPAGDTLWQSPLPTLGLYNLLGKGHSHCYLSSTSWPPRADNFN